jgi:serine/threonine-protein kinase
MKLAPGSPLGPYTILERIGRGGMATIYKAYQPALERNVAIKVLPDHLADEPGFRQRFHLEAVAVGRLRHPNILTIHDHGEQDGQTYIVSEFIEGGTLRDLLGKPLPTTDVVRLLAPVASALDYAHSMGVVHRDVKPTNILIGKDGAPVLSDFGLARMMESKERLTVSGMILGTPEYMAPEQCEGEEPRAAADIYSLGVVAYEMLTGRVPFSAATPAAVIIAQIQSELPLPRSINPNLPPRVEEALLKVLAKAPEVRFATATEMVDAIRAASKPVESAAPARMTVAASRPPQTREPRRLALPRLLTTLLVAILVLALAGGAYAFNQANKRGGGNLAAAARSPSAVASSAPSPSSPPLHAIPAKGPLIWRAALDGTNVDVQEPRVVLIGADSDSAIKFAKGYMEFDVFKPGANTGYNLQMRRLKAFVGEIDVAFQAGSDVFLWWSLTADTVQPGGYAVYIDAANESMKILHQRGSAHPDFTTADVPIPGLQKGTPITVAVVVNGQDIQLYLNEQRVLDFTASVAINAMNGQLFINSGVGGSYRITGVRYYALPASS